ncbi:MAG: NADH-quinone oxidoreductase subunit NuoK [Planctomycetes bacterium]|nr:NADH-quinone oxidoreductase subunit NuoK [Planctomycetota bacterium]
MTFFGAPVYFLAVALFALGIFGFLTRRNAIVVLMSVELMLNAANLTFLAAARGTAHVHEASAYAIFIILVAAAEAAVGLALVLALFRIKQSTDLDVASDLKG